MSRCGHFKSVFWLVVVKSATRSYNHWPASYWYSDGTWHWRFDQTSGPVPGWHTSPVTAQCVMLKWANQLHSRQHRESAQQTNQLLISWILVAVGWTQRPPSRAEASGPRPSLKWHPIECSVAPGQLAATATVDPPAFVPARSEYFHSTPRCLTEMILICVYGAPTCNSV